MMLRMPVDDLTEIYRSYGAMVYRRCLRLLRDRQEAMDITQETFVKAISHQHELRPGRELLGWLYRVGTNLCLNRLRESKARRTAPLPSTSSESPESNLVARVLASDLLAESDEQTQAIVLYVFIDGMTHDEAAQVAKVSPRTVRNKLARFLERGREWFGPAQEDVG
jgi:RNA polymerase sigma-70 factor (ECF subfamily)